jgi:hypothetical protein
MLANPARSTSGALQPSNFGTLLCLRQQGTKVGVKAEKKLLSNLVSTCLVVDCHKLCYYMQHLFTRKYGWRVRFSNKLGQCSLHPSLRSLFFVFHFFPDCAWNCPVVFQYVFLFASLLIFCIVLTDMLPTRRVSTSVECLSFAVFFHKHVVISIRSK